ncbi:porin family protein [Mangrovibacterium marinum]|uniref:Outer membrane protein with beta-barrel domain n=1 Tax=Mangrovibacterium marinum TaxID=1639118 RepID=A0A2T5C2I3_9BACT|nr:porin family protein [Mangrovibacterium marinum]PTN08953.1 outer membrane protein with beta-barrel domain [Mangrovibacterium marinum]
MKKILFLTLIALCTIRLYAQDTIQVKQITKTIVRVNEEPTKTKVSLLNDKISIEDNMLSDTTNIRVGRRNYQIIEGQKGSHIIVTKDVDVEKDWQKRKKFNGHWAGFELGINGLANTDYGMYPDPTNEFMELRQAASLEVNINFLEANICLKPDRVGLVSGFGLQWNNYKFENSITLDKIGGNPLIQPIDIVENNYKKSKLTASYLTVPLMLEFQFPVNDHTNTLFVSAGMVGALNLGSHTKVKNDHSKEKDHGSFNLNPFKYSAIARIGLRDLSFYATYSFSPLFKDGRGPELYPFTIGIALANF